MSKAYLKPSILKKLNVIQHGSFSKAITVNISRLDYIIQSYKPNLYCKLGELRIKKIYTLVSKINSFREPDKFKPILLRCCENDNELFDLINDLDDVECVVLVDLIEKLRTDKI